MKELFDFIKQLYSFSGKILYFHLLGMVVICLLDGIGTILLIPMLSISGILNMAHGTSTMWGFLAIFKGFPKGISLPIILGIYILLIVGQGLLERGHAIRDVKILHGLMNHIKEKTYRSLLHVRWEFYLKTRKSDLINNLTKDITQAGMGVKMFLQLLSNLIFTSIQIGFAFWLSPSITCLVLFLGGGLAFFSWKFVKQAKTLGEEATQLSIKYLAGITENLNGIKEIKTNTLEKNRVKWLTTLNENILKEQVDNAKLHTFSQLSYKAALAVLISAFIFLSVKLVHIQPEKILIIILIFSKLWPRFANIQYNLQQVASSLPACKVLVELQSETEAFRENIYEHNESEKPLSIKNRIECRHVFFRYNLDNPTFALQNINLQIMANHMTAIVGKSGAGKSTLVDILTGLNRPESGEVIVDGLPLSDHNLLALRKSIGFVPQDSFLFNESIKDNLLLMEPNATEQQMWEALAFAAADQFVKQLPNGLDTRIGDRGIRLSGGERQRLVLARAILRKPSILILDEATSALDTHNETKIQEALERIKGKMTIIIIAHRLSTIAHADQVIVLDQGKIVQNGGYSELSKDKKGMFNHFLNGQLKMSQ